MNYHYTKLIPMGAILAFTAIGAVAQTSTTPPNTSTTPSAVGVSPQTAAEANRNAVPRSDTGTVVRTAPSAADRARGAMDNSGTTANSGATGTNSMTGTSGNRSTAGMRRARADRN